MAQEELGFSMSRALKLPLRGVMYVINPLNWFNSWEKVGRDMHAAISDVTDPRPKVRLYAGIYSEMERSSVTVLGVFPGVVTFSLPRYRIGDLHKLNQKQKDEIKEKYPNIRTGGETDKIIVEIDTEEIQNRNQCSNKRETKRRTIRAISEKIASDLRGFTEITVGRGWFSRTHVIDNSLIKDIATVLYRSYNYTKHHEVDLSTQASGTVVHIANKGIMTECSAPQKQKVGENIILKNYYYNSYNGHCCIVLRQTHIEQDHGSNKGEYSGHTSLKQEKGEGSTTLSNPRVEQFGGKGKGFNR